MSSASVHFLIVSLICLPSNDDACKILYNSEGTIEALLADIPKLQSILTYHVLNGVVDQKAVKAATSLVTLNGKSTLRMSFRC